MEYYVDIFEYHRGSARLLERKTFKSAEDAECFTSQFNAQNNERTKSYYLKAYNVSEYNLNSQSSTA